MAGRLFVIIHVRSKHEHLATLMAYPHLLQVIGMHTIARQLLYLCASQSRCCGMYCVIRVLQINEHLLFNAVTKSLMRELRLAMHIQDSQALRSEGKFNVPNKSFKLDI